MTGVQTCALPIFEAVLVISGMGLLQVLAESGRLEKGGDQRDHRGAGRRARPFSQRMQTVLQGLVSRVDQTTHPLLRVPEAETERPLVIIVTADRGLCGSFNSNVIKAAGQFIVSRPSGSAVSLALVGRKGRDFFGRRGYDVRYETVGIFQRLTFADAAAIANSAMDDFTTGTVTSVHLVYNEFKSVMSQRLVVDQLLPIPRLESGTDAGPGVDYLYEPSAQGIFDELLPRYVQMQVYRALLESNAAFFAAQMTAMDAATRNSSEMIENLKIGRAHV